MGNDQMNNQSNAQKANYYKGELNERERNLPNKDLEYIQQSPWISYDEMERAIKYRNGPYNDYNHYSNVDQAFQRERGRFRQINLQIYKNNDGSFSVFKLQRPLGGMNSTFGVAANNAIQKMHHEGVAIGNGYNFIVFDYGKKHQSLDFAFKQTTNLNSEWAIVSCVGKCFKNQMQLENIFFGRDIENNFSSGRNYQFIGNNCQDYAQTIINKLLY